MVCNSAFCGDGVPTIAQLDGYGCPELSTSTFVVGKSYVGYDL